MEPADARPTRAVEPSDDGVAQGGGRLTTAEYSALTVLDREPPLSLEQLAAMMGTTREGAARIEHQLFTHNLIIHVRDASPAAHLVIIPSTVGRAVIAEMVARRPA